MREKLEERKEKYSKYGFPTEIYITIEIPTDKIIEYATDKKVDLIVIGSIGVSGISKF